MNDHEIYMEIRRRKIRQAFAKLLHDLYVDPALGEPLPLPMMEDEDVKKYIKKTLGL